MATKVNVNAMTYFGSTGNMNTNATLYDDTTGLSLMPNILHSVSMIGIGNVSQLVSAISTYVIGVAATNGYAVTATDFIWANSASVDIAYISSKMPYSRYASLVTQTGTSAPVNTDEINDFTGTTFTWARTSAGVYTVTASSAVFASGKTAGIYSPLTNLNGALSIVRTSSTVLTITTAVQALAVLGLLGFTATPTDAMLSVNLFEIRVYN